MLCKEQLRPASAEQASACDLEGGSNFWHRQGHQQGFTLWVCENVSASGHVLFPCFPASYLAKSKWGQQTLQPRQVKSES